MGEIKATSVGQAYKTQGGDLDIKVNKTFMVPVEHLVIEDGFNVRDLDQEHIQSMAESYREGRMMPALVIRTTRDGFKVIDGHHRLSAAKIASVHRLECKEFTGTEAEQIAWRLDCLGRWSVSAGRYWNSHSISSSSSRHLICC